jgi:hypothetical protein
MQLGLRYPSILSPQVWSPVPRCRRRNGGQMPSPVGHMHGHSVLTKWAPSGGTSDPPLLMQLGPAPSQNRPFGSVMVKSRIPRNFLARPSLPQSSKQRPTSEPDIGIQTRFRHHDTDGFYFAVHRRLPHHPNCSQEQSAQCRAELWQPHCGRSRSR